MPRRRRNRWTDPEIAWRGDAIAMLLGALAGIATQGYVNAQAADSPGPQTDAVAVQQISHGSGRSRQAWSTDATAADVEAHGWIRSI